MILIEEGIRPDSSMTHARFLLRTCSSDLNCGSMDWVHVVLNMAAT